MYIKKGQHILETLGAVAVESALRVGADGILVTDMVARCALVDVQTDLQAVLVHLGGKPVVAVAPEGVLNWNAHGVVHAVGSAIIAGIRLGGHAHLAHGANAQSFISFNIVQVHLGDLLQHIGGTGVRLIIPKAAAVQNPLLHLRLVDINIWELFKRLIYI